MGERIPGRSRSNNDRLVISCPFLARSCLPEALSLVKHSFSLLTHLLPSTMASMYTNQVGAVGPHYQDESLFQESFKSFMNLLRSYPRPGDYVFIRTVPTGHENCRMENENVEPLPDFREYKKMYREVDVTSRWYHWEKHELYNQIMEAETIKLGRDASYIGAKVEILDIFFMTALRHDGHPTAVDCLHYLLPGPPDWWNHLFYSNLLDLARSMS